MLVQAPKTPTAADRSASLRGVTRLLHGWSARTSGAEHRAGHLEGGEGDQAAVLIDEAQWPGLATGTVNADSQAERHEVGNLADDQERQGQPHSLCRIEEACARHDLVPGDEGLCGGGGRSAPPGPWESEPKLRTHLHVRHHPLAPTWGGTTRSPLRQGRDGSPACQLVDGRGNRRTIGAQRLRNHQPNSVVVARADGSPDQLCARLRLALNRAPRKGREEARRRVTERGPDRG